MCSIFTHAITRRPGSDFAQGITTADLGIPNYNLILQQHEAYLCALRSLGLDITVLDPLLGCPDAYFVEDPAIVLPEIAVITRPGALPRRGELDTIEAALAPYRSIVRIEPPGTIEGG